ncbi:MAG: TAXI family TRAP transporter solute-binding subunit, partial [Treponema sp.]|nr:TAXI family TRAP transporter solute-binding subunit [Treponema sp.]
YTKTVIPGGTYNGTDDDIDALAIKATLAVNAELDEDTVYEMTKTLFNNLDELSQANAKGKEVSVPSAVTGVSVPFHPGAKKFFAEVGFTVE